MNNRPITEEDLHSFVDRTLDPRREAEVSVYLEAHPDVAERIGGYAEQRDMLRAALAPVAEEPLPPELDLARMIERRRRPGLAPRWAAVAAVALLCLGGAGGWSLRDMVRPSLEGVAALAQEAAESYAVYAPDHVHPVEVRAADRDELVGWASRRLGYQVAVPDLAASGYRFMGGRVVATAHGPAALFMYDDDHGTRLVMLTRSMAVDQNTPMSPHAYGPVNGFAWAEKGLGYSLVGPAAPETLHPIANEVRRQISKAI